MSTSDGNFLDILGKGVETMDRVNDQTFNQDAAQTIFFVLTLMDIQTLWTNQQENDRTQAVIYALNPTAGDAAIASEWQVRYNMDYTNGNSSQQAWENMALSNESKISNDFDQKAGNLKAAANLQNSVLDKTSALISSMR